MNLSVLSISISCVAVLGVIVILLVMLVSRKTVKEEENENENENEEEEENEEENENEEEEEEEEVDTALTSGEPYANYASRSEFVNDVLNGTGAQAMMENGMSVYAGGDFYRCVKDANAIPDLPGWLPLNDVWVEHFGAITTAGRTNTNKTSVDNTDAIQHALDYIATLGGGRVNFRENYYRVTSPLELNSRGMILVGVGDQETYIFADHVDGPVIHITRETSQLMNLCIDASDARRDSGDVVSRNYGVLYETLDVSQRLQASYARALRVQNQPSHGFYASTVAYTGTVTNCWFLNNRGHGVLIDRGTASGVSDPVDVSGLVSFNECQVRTNGGHAFCLGNANDMVSTTQALRVNISNCEISNNASNEVVRFTPTFATQVYMHGATEILFQTNVFSCKDVVNGVGAVIEGGRSIVFTNNRFISVLHAVVVDSYVTYPTLGVFIQAFNVINSPNMTHAVWVQNTTGDENAAPRGVFIHNYNYPQKLVGNASAAAAADVSVGGTQRTVTKTEPQSVTGTELVEDVHLKFWVGTNVTVTFSMVVAYTGPSFKLRLVGPSESVVRYGPSSGVKIGVLGDVVPQALVDQNTTIEFGSASEDAPRVLKLVGSVENGSRAGVVVVKWAQVAVVAGAAETRVLPYVSHVMIDHVVAS